MSFHPLELEVDTLRYQQGNYLSDLNDSETFSDQSGDKMLWRVLRERANDIYVEHAG